MKKHGHLNKEGAATWFRTDEHHFDVDLHATAAVTQAGLGDSLNTPSIFASIRSVSGKVNSLPDPKMSRLDLPKSIEAAEIPTPKHSRPAMVRPVNASQKGRGREEAGLKAG